MKSAILADHPGLGCIRVCECNAVHVNVGPVTINLEPEAFFQVLSMMNRASEKLATMRGERAMEALDGVELALSSRVN